MMMIYSVTVVQLHNWQLRPNLQSLGHGHWWRTAEFGGPQGYCLCHCFQQPFWVNGHFYTLLECYQSTEAWCKIWCMMHYLNKNPCLFSIIAKLIENLEWVWHQDILDCIASLILQRQDSYRLVRQDVQVVELAVRKMLLHHERTRRWNCE